MEIKNSKEISPINKFLFNPSSRYLKLKIYTKVPNIKKIIKKTIFRTVLLLI